MAELRLPNISGTDREQLTRIRSYLYQLIPELQFLLENIESKLDSSASATVLREDNTEVCRITVKATEGTFTLDLTPSNIIYKKNGKILWKK
jgi:hypothetical protein